MLNMIGRNHIQLDNCDWIPTVPKLQFWGIFAAVMNSLSKHCLDKFDCRVGLRVSKFSLPFIYNIQNSNDGNDGFKGTFGFVVGF